MSNIGHARTDTSSMLERRDTAVDLLVAASWCAAAGRGEAADELVDVAGELLEPSPAAGVVAPAPGDA